MTDMHDHRYGNRTHPRVEFVEPVNIQVQGENDQRQVSALNLSLKGMFIKCTEPLPVGTRLAIQFTTQAGPVYAQEGRVVWSRQENQKSAPPQPTLRPIGMGVCFEKLAGQSESIIQQVVEDWLMDERDTEPCGIESEELNAIRASIDPKKTL